VMEILKTKLKSPVYLQHSGRLLMALAPLPEEKRRVVLSAVFQDRKTVEEKAKRGELPVEVLEIYYYLHDIR
ncbi:MAG: hypothetical protein QXT46_04875, partial [Pyrobaculum sp.]